MFVEVVSEIKVDSTWTNQNEWILGVKKWGVTKHFLLIVGRWCVWLHLVDPS